MFDGINSQAAFFCIIIFLIFMMKNIFISTSAITIFVLLFFLFYNFNSKMFLGDSGTQVLAFLISYILIKSYNFYGSFRPDEILQFYHFQDWICLGFLFLDWLVAKIHLAQIQIIFII